MMHEHAVLTQEISFLEVVGNYFSKHGIQPDTTPCNDPDRHFSDGRPVPVMAYYAGTLEKYHVMRPALYPPGCR
jgi:hypothetical protein